MEEEKIIEIVKDYIQYKETDGNIQAKTIGLIDDAIQGLLDLYEKEKEKNIYLTQELETRKWVKIKENGEVEPAFYISKDKIREKLDEIYKEYQEILNSNRNLQEKNIATFQHGAMRTVLEELLEEE